MATLAVVGDAPTVDGGSGRPLTTAASSDGQPVDSAAIQQQQEEGRQRRLCPCWSKTTEDLVRAKIWKHLLVISLICGILIGVGELAMMVVCVCV